MGPCSWSSGPQLKWYQTTQKVPKFYCLWNHLKFVKFIIYNTCSCIFVPLNEMFRRHNVILCHYLLPTADGDENLQKINSSYGYGRLSTEIVPLFKHVTLTRWHPMKMGPQNFELLRRIKNRIKKRFSIIYFFRTKHLFSKPQTGLNSHEAPLCLAPANEGGAEGIA